MGQNRRVRFDAVWRALGMALTFGASACGASFVPLGPPGAADCVDALASTQVQPIGVRVPLLQGAGPFASGGRVFSERNLGTTRTEQVQVFSLDPRERSEQELTRSDDFNSALLDAHGGAALYLETAAVARTRSLVYADANGKRVLLSAPVAPAPGEVLAVERPRDGTHLVGPGRAVAITNSGTWYFEGSAKTLIAEGFPQTRAVHAFEEGVLFSTAEGLHLWSRGERSLLVAGNDWFRMALGSRGQVFWADASGVTRLDLASGRRTTLATGFCANLSIDAGRLLFTCADQDGPGRLGTRLGFFDGERVRELPTLGGDLGRTNLSGERVVWLEYDPPAPERWLSGRVVVASTDGGTPRTLARVAGPCFNCGHRWSPAAALSLEGDLLAWSYADPARPSDTAHQAQAYVVLPRVCE